MKRILLLLQMTLSLIPVFAQDSYTSYSFPDSTPSLRTGDISCSILNNNFLKNNEYFDPITEGITYFGSSLQPEIAYAFSSKARLSAGWFFRYYYGTDKFNCSLPVFRLEYEPIQNMRIVFGQLYGSLEHGLIDPVYGADNYFSRMPENGLQVILKGNKVHTDVWMSWDHFILPGDPSQEEISAGISADYRLTAEDNPHSLHVALQGIIHHYGGQVDLSDAPLQTRLNLAPGLAYKHLSDNNQGFTFSTFIIQASDPSGTVTIPYKKGFASYSMAMTSYKFISVGLSYFHGEYYFSPLGDPIYQSISSLNNWYTSDIRNIAGGKIIMDKELLKGVRMGFRSEAFYDMQTKNFNFNYGLNIRANASWLLHSGKKNRHVE